MEPFATEFWPNISYTLSLRTRGAKRYHLWFPVSTKELLILLKLAHKSLHPQGCSFLSPTPPHLCRRYYDTSPPCFLSYPRPHHPCPHDSCWSVHTRVYTPIPPHPFPVARVFFLKRKPVHCTTFLKTLRRLSVVLGVKLKPLNTIYKALHKPRPCLPLQPLPHFPSPHRTPYTPLCQPH